MQRYRKLCVSVALLMLTTGLLTGCASEVTQTPNATPPAASEPATAQKAKQAAATAMPLAEEKPPGVSSDMTRGVGGALK